MADIRLTLGHTRDETPTIRSFHFTPGSTFGWTAGQYLMMRLDVDDPRSPFRSFTIASSPTEGEVMIATRILDGSPFKRALASLKSGKDVTAKAPLGKFTLHEDTGRPAVFVAGGIGITPFRSMIRYATDARLPMNLVLLYGCRSEPEIAFRADLEAWRERNERLRIVYALTRPKPSWRGRRGRIDADLIRANVGALGDAAFYVCGRPEFVSDLRTTIMEMGVPRERVKSEQFPGYA